MKLSVSLTDPTNVLEVLQDSSVGHLTLDLTALRLMVRDCVSQLSHVVECSFCSICLICFVLYCLQIHDDQLRLRAMLAGMRSGQVCIDFQQELQFPYRPWFDPRISPGLPETLCVCTGLSENPHIRGAEVSGVPLCLLSEAQCLLMKSASCRSITVNGESLHQVESFAHLCSDEESFV